MAMPSLRILARIALVGAAIAIASPAPAQDIDSAIVLPDEPYVLPVLSSYVFPADPQSGDVLTQRANNNRDSATYVRGVNSTTVRDFQRIGSMPTSGCKIGPDHIADGSGVFTQPLYAGSALVQGAKQPVVLFVSLKNVVYAYSARMPFNLLWSTCLGDPGVAPDFYTTDQHDPRPQPQLICYGRVGTVATPVVDLLGNQIIVSFQKSDATHNIAALDLNDGHVISQKQLLSPLPAQPQWEWDRMHLSRASLLLAGGVVYVAMTGVCEPAPQGKHFYGSIFAFRASDLEPAGKPFLVTTGNPVDGGGIWQASTGLAADSIGNLYIGTGNPADNGKDNQGNAGPRLDEPSFTDSVLRLKVETNQAFNNPSVKPSLTFAVADYFTPYRKVWLDFADMDIAASGIVLIPSTHYLVAAGKEGLLYTLDRADLGHFDARPTQPSWHAANIDVYFNDALHGQACIDHDVSQRVLRCAEYSPRLLNDDPARDFVHQKFKAGVNQYDVPNCSDAMRPCFFGDLNHVDLFAWGKWPHIHGTPVFARFGADKQYLFVWPEKDYLKRFTFNGTLFDPTPLKSGVIAPPYPGQDTQLATGMPGGILAVNIDGNQGVLFAALQRCATDPDPSLLGRPCNDQTLGSLRAYDPFTLKEVWNDCGTGPLPGDCELGHTGINDYYFAKWVPPTVAGGQVFLATAPPPPWIAGNSDGKVIVYGKP